MGALRRKRERGFTLVEVMVTVILIAILASLAAPSFQSTLARFRVRTAVESIASGLQLARTEALRRNQAVEFQFSEGGRKWSVGTTSPVSVIQEAPGELHSSLSLTTNAAADASENRVTFDASGLVVASANRIRQVDVTSSVSGVSGWRVEVHGGGLIQVCDPAATGNDSRRC